MKPQVMGRDIERLTIALASELLAAEDCTVGLAPPSDWTRSSVPHLSIASDGEPLNPWPIATQTTVRLTARAGSPTEAKRICRLAFGLLCAYAGDDVITNIQPLTGVLPALDPDTTADLASATVRVTTRTEPIDS